MKTLTKLGITFLLIGVAIFVVELVLAGGDITKIGFNTYDLVDARYECTTDVEEIFVDESTGKVELVTGDVDKVVIDYNNDKKKVLYTITEKDKKVTIDRKNDKSFFNLSFGIGDTPKVLVTVPKDFDGVITLGSSTGSITVSDVNVEKLSADCTTGSVKITNVSAEDIVADATTGSIKLTNVEAKKSLHADCTTGSITLDKVNGGDDIVLESTTGSIKGTLIGNEDDYAVEADTTTGSCNLKNYRGGDKSLSAHTTTGSIKVNFVEE